jgi:outer membrane protein assembly factor BamB
MFKRLPILATFVTVGIGAMVLPALADNWPLFGHDPARSGVDVNGRILTVSNVHGLRTRWQISFGGGAVADSTPILLERVPYRGKLHRMLFQTTKNGVTYGIDAYSGSILWHFATHGPKITTSTPAADPSGTAVYVPGVDGYVRKVEAATGHELAAPGFPLKITLMRQTEKDASPLNVANGLLYATTSGYLGDAPPYDGHVVSLRLSNGAKHVFNSLCSNDRDLPTPTSCSFSDSGIWSRGGAVVDPDPQMVGQVFVTTGNGDFSANHGGHNYGDSVIGLTHERLDVVGSYTPANYDQLERNDTDLGSTSPALLPRQTGSSTPLMLAQGGKDQILRLVNRNPLPGVAGELQEISLTDRLFSTPAVWTDPSGRVWLFLGFPQTIEAYRLETSGGKSRLVGIWKTNVGQSTGEGSSPVVSNGIVFGAVDNAVVALNALTGSELWSSSMPGVGKTIGPVHWESPIVINGWVYCSDENGNLTAFALPGARGMLIPHRNVNHSTSRRTLY